MPRDEAHTVKQLASSGIPDARFHVLAYALDEPIVVVDAANHVLFANPAADRLCHGPAGHLVGAPFLLPLGAMKSERATLSLPSGQSCPVLVTVSAMVWDGVAAHLGILRPLEPAMRAVTAAVETVRSRFLAHLSHELRTPLNTILGFAEAMKSELFGPLGSERYQSYAEHIYLAGGRLATLVSDLLDLSRAESGELPIEDSVFDLSMLIDAAIPEARERTAQRIRAAGPHVHVDHGTPVLLRADREKLFSAVQHLVMNGLAFTPGDGEVRVSTNLMRDRRIIIRVADNGRGISSDELEGLFKPFARASAVERADPLAGPGVGLALVRRYIELHGGAVRIDSTQGLGTKVTCIIPADRVVLDFPENATASRHVH